MMNLQFARKYVRVKNANFKPSPKANVLSSAPLAIQRVQACEQLNVQPGAGNNSPKTYVQSSNEAGDIILEEVQYDNGSTTFIDYAVSMDELNSNFSSTTIVNGTAISLSELQFAEGGSNDSVLVMPLDSLDVPLETMVGNENEIRTIHVGDYSTATEEPCNEKVSVINPNSCRNQVIRNNRVSSSKHPNWLTSPKPAKQLKTETKMYYPDKSIFPTNQGGRRGLIRFGRSRMIADTHTTIAVSEFKNQLNDTSDIIGRLDLAPSSKVMMHLLNTKGVNKLFANPGRGLGSKIRKGFIRHLSLRQTPVDVTYDDMPLLPVGFTPTVDPKTIKRITRKRRYPEAEEYQRRMSAKNKVIKTEEVEVPEYEEVIIPDCKDTVILLSNMNSANQPALDDEGNIYSDEFNPTITGIEEEQELGSLPFTDTLGNGTELAENQEFHSGEEELITGDEYTGHNQFQDNKATIIMMENENGSQENVEVLLSTTADDCGMDEEGHTQVIFCNESDEEGKEIMILPCEPTFMETVITS